MPDFLTQEYDRLKHPVYNSLGREIGYYSDLQTLATGHINLYEGETAPPSDQLMVNCGIFAIRKNAGDCLLSQGITPAWASADQVAQAQTANQPFSFSDIIPPISLGSPSGGIALPGLPSLDGTSIGTVAVWAGVGLVALLAVRKAFA